MDRISLDAASLIKRRREDEAIELIRKRSERKYEDTFAGYMTAKLSEKKLKRREVALVAGLNPDYMYKVLRETKRTTNRDYIIAFCMAAHFTMDEIDDALSLYKAPALEETGRDLVIRSAVCAGSSLDSVNDLLEKAGFQMIMTAPDEDKEKIGPDRTIARPKKKVVSDHQTKTRRMMMREIESRAWSELVMVAPCDYEYLAESKLELDNGDVVYALVSFAPFGTSFEVNKKPYGDDFDPDTDTIELYRWECTGECNFLTEDEVAELFRQAGEEYDPDDWDTIDGYVPLPPNADADELLLKAAEKSEFFPYFMKLNYMTDRMIAEDSKYYEDFFAEQEKREKEERRKQRQAKKQTAPEVQAEG